jgi:signal transduction histidine kinase
MRERLNELHGRFDIEAAGIGTTVRATIPFNMSAVDRPFPPGNYGLAAPCLSA